MAPKTTTTKTTIPDAYDDDVEKHHDPINELNLGAATWREEKAQKAYNLRACKSTLKRQYIYHAFEIKRKKEKKGKGAKTTKRVHYLPFGYR